jgi:hypothetical protein
MKNTTFYYCGYHFTPVRKFRKGEIKRRLANDSRPWKIDAKHAMRNMKSEKDMDFPSYSHWEFYDASGNSQMDIFKCDENGKLYVPCENQLYRYDVSQADAA